MIAVLRLDDGRAEWSFLKLPGLSPILNHHLHLQFFSQWNALILWEPSKLHSTIWLLFLAKCAYASKTIGPEAGIPEEIRDEE